MLKTRQVIRQTKSGPVTRFYPIFDEEYEQALTSLDNMGLCIACGEEAYGVEPDARQYECESCGQRKVFGLEELLISSV